jgi:hypothetical protein
MEQDAVIASSPERYCTQKDLVLGSSKSATMEIIICPRRILLTLHTVEPNAHDFIQRLEFNALIFSPALVLNIKPLVYFRQ